MDLPITVSFRLARRDDVPKFEWFGQYTHFRNLFRKAFREQERGQRLILVADCADFPIGHVFILLHSENERIADGQTRGYFYSFRVMEMFRGQGLGTRLLTEAEAILLERGFHWATIAAAKDNARARQLYERLGYTVFAEDIGEWSYTDHRGTLRNVHEPSWLLEKQLLLR
jgi:ribosomal protein S18 acetylase RimI-like enzyme